MKKSKSHQKNDRNRNAIVGGNLLRYLVIAGSIIFSVVAASYFFVSCDKGNEPAPEPEPPELPQPPATIDTAFVSIAGAGDILPKFDEIKTALDAGKPVRLNLGNIAVNASDIKALADNIAKFTQNGSFAANWSQGSIQPVQQGVMLSLANYNAMGNPALAAGPKGEKFYATASDRDSGGFGLYTDKTEPLTRVNSIQYGADGAELKKLGQGVFPDTIYFSKDINLPDGRALETAANYPGKIVCILPEIPDMPGRTANFQGLNKNIVSAISYPGSPDQGKTSLQFNMTVIIAPYSCADVIAWTDDTKNILPLDVSKMSFGGDGYFFEKLRNSNLSAKSEKDYWTPYVSLESDVMDFYLYNTDQQYLYKNTYPDPENWFSAYFLKKYEKNELENRYNFMLNAGIRCIQDALYIDSTLNKKRNPNGIKMKLYGLEYCILWIFVGNAGGVFKSGNIPNHNDNIERLVQEALPKYLEEYYSTIIPSTGNIIIGWHNLPGRGPVNSLCFCEDYCR